MLGIVVMDPIDLSVNSLFLGRGGFDDDDNNNMLISS